MEQFWSTLPEHCFSLLMFAGIHLCTALLRLCHSISIGLKCRLWVIAIFWFFPNMASYLVLEYFDYDHCRRSPNLPPFASVLDRCYELFVLICRVWFSPNAQTSALWSHLCNEQYSRSFVVWMYLCKPNLCCHCSPFQTSHTYSVFFFFYDLTFVTR